MSMKSCFRMPIFYIDFSYCQLKQYVSYQPCKAVLFKVKSEVFLGLDNVIKKKLSGATSREQVGGLPCRFLKIDKKCPVFGKFTLFMCIYGLNSHLKDSFKSVLGKKHEIFPCGCLLFYGVLEVFIKVPLSQETCSVLKSSWLRTFNSHPNFSS